MRCLLWRGIRSLALWQETMHPEQREQSIYQMWQTEREQLMKLPPPFDGYIEHIKRVSPICLVSGLPNKSLATRIGIALTSVPSPMLSSDR
jgi:hypothetical protein